MAISLAQAKALAETAVRALADASNDEFGLVRNETIDEGWLFFYDSKEFIETGDYSTGLAGNGPIFVDRDGVVKTLPSNSMAGGDQRRLTDVYNFPSAFFRSLTLSRRAGGA